MGQAVMIATGGRVYPPDYSLHTLVRGYTGVSAEWQTAQVGIGPFQLALQAAWHTPAQLVIA